MTDPAVERDAAEEASAFSHPAVAPDATASYGEHPDQVVDFYAPRGDAGKTGMAARPAGATALGPAPLVVVLHGGAWRAPYDRQHITPFVDFLARQGFAVANIEYRRGSALPRQGAAGPVAGRWPDTFDDVAAALDALPDLVPAHLPQADVRRMVLTGHSAGGQLALWAAGRHVLPAGDAGAGASAVDPAGAWRLPAPPQLRGVVALAPIADFVVAEELGVCGGASAQLLGGEEFFASRLPYADPAALLPTGIATAIVHGRADLVVPAAVSEAYVAAAAKAGETVGLTLLADVGHFPLIDPSADACAVVAEEIAQLAW
ncbi:alpha/beta hydrolase [Streptomyces venezuelae]|uniref:Alpha/beta hydrolase n=1 Tax=Streptomyces venezuelae TaxID=54571 RepID=A0A5P2D5I9_STRVZ|nr:alpha/beta hydrolase [Streptomyces venezuelae]QES49338.1 alpha/beta hydrolase [Streptomyces venezuelae]